MYLIQNLIELFFGYKNAYNIVLIKKFLRSFKIYIVELSLDI